MNKAQFSNKGQALVIFVFAIIGLIGMTGLAIDGTNTLAERRQAQNAADTAAMAGALAKINGQKDNTSWTNTICSTPYSSCWNAITNAAGQRAQSNGYANILLDGIDVQKVEVYVPPISGPYSDCTAYDFRCEDYVQVFITSRIDTYFAKVLGVPSMTNKVEAVALAKYAAQSSLFGGNSLVVLDPHETTCSGEFTLSGSATVTLDGGGIFVNSDNTTCAWKYTNGCATLKLLNGADVKVVGNTDPGTSCTQTPPLVIQHPDYQYPYPPEPMFDEPAACGQAPQPSYTDGNGFIHYRPGFYSMLPPDHNVILEPGVYCVQNMVKTLNPTTLKTLDQDLTTAGKQGGVFIYIKHGGSFNFQGGTVDLFAISDVNSPYYGFLIYVDSEYTGTHLNCIVNGGADDTYTGVIYAPDCDITINGGSDSLGLTAQVIGYRMTVNGNNALNIIFNQDKMPQVPEIRKTGLFR